MTLFFLRKDTEGKRVFAGVAGLVNCEDLKFHFAES